MLLWTLIFKFLCFIPLGYMPKGWIARPCDNFLFNFSRKHQIAFQSGYTTVYISTSNVPEFVSPYLQPSLLLSFCYWSCFFETGSHGWQRTHNPTWGWSWTLWSSSLHLPRSRLQACVTMSSVPGICLLIIVTPVNVKWCVMILIFSSLMTNGVFVYCMYIVLKK